jgi:hypothetical protein
MKESFQPGAGMLLVLWPQRQKLIVVLPGVPFLCLGVEMLEDIPKSWLVEQTAPPTEIPHTAAYRLAIGLNLLEHAHLDQKEERKYEIGAILEGKSAFAYMPGQAEAVLIQDQRAVRPLRQTRPVERRG